MPDWMRMVADFNPLEWDVVATRAGMVTGFLVLCAWFALRALERYQRSL